MWVQSGYGYYDFPFGLYNSMMERKSANFIRVYQEPQTFILQWFAALLVCYDCLSCFIDDGVQMGEGFCKIVG